MPTAIDRPWPSEPVAASMPGSAIAVGMALQRAAELAQGDERPLREEAGLRHDGVERGHARGPSSSTMRSRSAQSGRLGS